ncbi:MAG: sigma-70 family RNA polymerase sigma factor [Bacilli bacterium]
MYEKLPCILTKNETTKLFIELKNGNLLAKQKLAEHNIKLVIYHVKRFHNLYKDLYEFEDLVSVGTIGLMKAIDSYQCNKTVFSNYASICIINEIFMYTNKESRRKSGLAEHIISTKDLSEEGAQDIAGDILDFIPSNDPLIEEVYEDSELKANVLELIEILNLQQKDILLKYYGFYERSYSQKELSIIYGVSQSAISKIISKSLNILKKEIELKQSNHTLVIHK